MSRTDPNPDAALLLMIQAADAMGRVSNRLAGVMHSTGCDDLFAANCNATRDLSRKLWMRIRATLPATEEGARAKRKLVDDPGWPDHDAETVELCARQIAFLDAYESLSGDGDSHEQKAAWADYERVRAAVLASKPLNIETVVAKAKVAAREGKQDAPVGDGATFGRAVVDDLIRLGGAL